jgi:hypothetical protein
MLDRMPAWLEWKHVALLAVGWGLLMAGSFAIVLRILLALPPEYFENERSHRALWTVARVARNAAGVALMAVGLVLSIPGVPGQGALTVLTGLLLVDFPRRRSLERALARRPGVLPMLNRLRARFGRAPLRPPPPADSAS